MLTVTACWMSSRYRFIKDTSMRPKDAVALIVFVYAVSLCLPAIDYRDPRVDMGGELYWGAECVYIPFVIAIPAWWANVALGVGLFKLGSGRYDVAFFLGILATALALQGALHVSGQFSLWSKGYRNFPLHIGYFVWLACHLSLTFAAKHYMKERERSASAPQPEPAG
jgi:hypothetical protein